MIDRETALSWAKDAGFAVSMLQRGHMLATSNDIQALITRAQAEAFEQAAQECDRIAKAGPNCDGYGLAQEIRALKKI